MENQSRERKNNKGKALIIVVAMILMLVLVVGMGAMTYARYKTSGTSGTQTATAAKWGYVITVDAGNLFGTDYNYDTSKKISTIATSDGVAVNASGDANVVAPGTTGYIKITVTGSAEVLAKLSISVNGTPTEIHCGDYYPVKWKLEEGEATDAAATNTLTTLTNVSKDLSAGGTDISQTYTLSWVWALEDTDPKSNKDVYDTAIGYKAQGKPYNDVKDLYVGSTQIGAGTSPIISTTDYDAIKTEMSFELIISVEQVLEKSSTPST